VRVAGSGPRRARPKWPDVLQESRVATSRPGIRPHDAEISLGERILNVGDLRPARPRATHPASGTWGERSATLATRSWPNLRPGTVRPSSGPSAALAIGRVSPSEHGLDAPIDPGEAGRRPKSPGMQVWPNTVAGRRRPPLATHRRSLSVWIKVPIRWKTPSACGQGCGRGRVSWCTNRHPGVDDPASA
jgi:hypothetical protein